MRFVLLIVLLLAQSEPSLAATHTWVPKAKILSNGSSVVTLPQIDVTGHIDWGSGDFDTPVSETANLSGGGAG